MSPARLPHRFQLVRELGRGGMGTVYEAYDEERGGRVAIKTLPSNDPVAVARFKKEFRSLQDIHHPNLVTLSELFCEDGQWAFSMSLIEGVDFIEYVRPENAPTLSEQLFGTTTEAASQVVPSKRSPARAKGESPKSPPPIPQARQNVHVGYDEERLRSALTQLVLGVSALHEAHKVHRDIKPSNIRVRPDGHLFLLDFGLIDEAAHAPAATVADNILGTPTFMAPEQATTVTVGTPADWYSVGVVLFVALTGHLPFDGTPMQVLAEKQVREAPRAKRICPAVPDDLDELCARLLARDPFERPNAESILSALESHARPSPSIPVREPMLSLPPPFVGRADELQVLDVAFRSAQGGKSEVVILEGDSGTGKSFLARRFLDRIEAAHPTTVVITGRCYENEAVPYNAWDGAIDSLASYWRKLMPHEASALLPTQIVPLAQTFPALKSVSCVKRAATLRTPNIDTREVRSRAFSALRDLFERITQRAPLIVFLDDVQWADHDSISLLGEVLRAPFAPPLLLIATARPLADYPDVERELRALLPAEVKSARVRELPEGDAIQLATEILSRKSPNLASLATAIAHEARGHALFIAELSNYLDVHREVTRGSLSLEEVLEARIEKLPPSAQSLLTVLALASRPLPEIVAARAAGLPPGEMPLVLSMLRIGHLSRATRVRGEDWLEPYHDRVRNAANRKVLGAEQKSVSRAIALALEESHKGDVNRLAEYWGAAGDPERAGLYARKAGDLARAALAFDRAAEFYETALARPSCSKEERHALLVTLGDTLGEAGRGKEAADVYQRAMVTSSPLEHLDLEQRSASLLFRSGHPDLGLALAKKVLARVHLRFPASILETALFLIGLRLFLSLRSRAFTEKREDELSREELVRIDVCQWLSLGLLMASTLRAVVFQMQHLRLALRAGEIGRVSLALSLEAAEKASRSGKHSPQEFVQLRKRLEEVRALAKRTGDANVVASADIATAVTFINTGLAREGREYLGRAEKRLREECAGKTWEIVSAEIWSFVANFFLGDYENIGRVQSKAMQEAQDRRDLYGLLYLRMGYGNVAWLVRDDPSGAGSALTEATRIAQSTAFAGTAHLDLLARVNLSLYNGESGQALRAVENGWGAVRASLVRIFPLLRLGSSEYRARAHIASADTTTALGRRQLALAKRWTRDTARTNFAFAEPLAALLEAQLAAISLKEADAVRLLRHTVESAARYELDGYRAVAERALGKVLRGDEGAKLVLVAEGSLRTRTVKNIPAFCRALAPGFARYE